jgi:hypothetical protein
MICKVTLRLATSWLILSALGSEARADAEARQPDDSSKAPAAAASKPFKLTFGRYQYSAGATGVDVNLRYRSGETSAWLGIYHDRDFGQQWRTGLERAFALIDGMPLSLQLSGQAASRGFLGGSMTLEYGEPWFVSAGLGRTNNKSYFNLNFDPNDAFSAAFGYRAASGLSTYVYAVRDNRFNPGQQNTHWVLKLPLAARQRFTIDLQRKTGLGPDRSEKDWALALTWDFRDWSIRLADDRKQNFGDVDALRLSVAYRF